MIIQKYVRQGLMGMAWPIVCIASDAGSLPKASPAPAIPPFSVSTPCDWYKETRRTNTWFQRDQSPRAKLNDLYVIALATRTTLDQEKLAAIRSEMIAVDTALSRELDDLVERCGWPSTTAFGVRAVEAAYFIVLHAPLEYQVKYFGVMSDAVRAGELERRHLAQLEDRIRVSQGLPQRYGTQIRTLDEKGTRAPFPIQDEERVDQRRAEVGIVPVSLCSYLSLMSAHWSRCGQ